MKWLSRVESLTTIANPPQLLRWNSHKGYLPQLIDNGIATVPSICLSAGSTIHQVS
jgi:hypothetical protein